MLNDTKGRVVKRNACIAALLISAGLLAGCSNKGNDQNSTDLRALNAVVDSEPLDVLVADDVKIASLAVGATSSYSHFSSGTEDVAVRSATNTTVLSTKSVNLASGARQTLLIYGRRSAVSMVTLLDDTSDASSGKFKVRSVGLSPDAGAVDLYVTSGDIASIPATISSVGYGSITDYAEVSSGSYRFVFTAAGTKEVLFESATQAFASNAAVSIAVFPSSGGRLVNAVLLTGGTDGSGTFLANASARVKAVNAIADSSALNFKADGATLLSSVPFAGSSSYVTLAAGQRTLQVESGNVPGIVIASLAKQLDPARDYSLIAVDSIAQPQLAALADDNSLPTTGYAKLRFANVLSGASGVDALVNFASQASGIAYKGASAYAQLPAGTSYTYTITFSTPGGVTALASLAGAVLDSGGVYSAYLVGPASAAQVKLVRDR